MGDYFECEVKTNSEDVLVAKVYLRLLPRIGEHMLIQTDGGKDYKCTVKDIWHSCGGDKVGHRVYIYVSFV
jgi:hypothetical protein